MISGLRFLLRALFAALLVSAGPAHSWGATTWEVAVIFLGRGEAPAFQSDIDANILELAKTEPGDRLRLSILREIENRRVTAHFDSATTRAQGVWDPLFSKVPLAGVKVPGVLRTSAARNGVFDEDEKFLKSFLAQAFKKPLSRRLLVIYGHGEGYRGLRGVPLARLQKKLEESLPRRNARKSLDLLWFNSCFMASLEVFTQLRHLSDVFIGSQESEFSSGMPFDALGELIDEGIEDSSKAAAHLAYRYIESYSFIKKGSQTSAVAGSGATVSVVESRKLESLWPALRDVSERLRGRELTPLQKISSRVSMEDPRFVDLGRWLKELQERESDPAFKRSLRSLGALLETNRVMRIQKSPRVFLRAPVAPSRLVYGYEKWSRGFEEDSDVIGLLSGSLAPAGYVRGERGKAWPFRSVQKRLIVQPFLPGLNRFDVFWQDGQGKGLGGLQSYERHRDFAVGTAVNPRNPVIFSARTWSAGTQSDRYTGLNIADPSQGLPTIDYLESELQRLTGWANF